MPRKKSSRKWTLTKTALGADLIEIEKKSPALHVQSFRDLGDKVSAIFTLGIPTLVQPTSNRITCWSWRQRRPCIECIPTSIGSGGSRADGS